MNENLKKENYPKKNETISYKVWNRSDFNYSIYIKKMHIKIYIYPIIVNNKRKYRKNC